MRIGIVTTYYQSVGGISTFVKNVVAHSQASGSSPLIFSPSNTNAGEDERFIPLDPRSRVSVMISLIRHLGRNNIRFIQCHGTWYLLLACILYKNIRKMSGIEVRVVTVKHSDMSKPGRIKRLILQTIDNSSNGIVFVSNYLKKQYMNEFGFVFDKPIKIVNPGCGTVTIRQEVQAMLASRLGLPARRPLLTYVGLFEYPEKVRGLILLLESIAKLRSRMPEIQLVIAGHGSLKWVVMEAIERLGLETAVQVIENLDGPYELLQLSDLHCHVSFQDSFGLVVLEALNSSTPVVASATGELPHIEIDGLVIAAADAESIAAALAVSIEHPPRVDVTTVRERYDWKIAAMALNSFTLDSRV